MLTGARRYWERGGVWGSKNNLKRFNNFILKILYVFYIYLI